MHSRDEPYLQVNFPQLETIFMLMCTLDNAFTNHTDVFCYSDLTS